MSERNTLHEAFLDELRDMYHAEKQLTNALRTGSRDPGLPGEWMRANHAFHDVIYAAAGVPLVERLAKSARRAFMGQAAWGVGSDLDDMYVRNDLEHRAIREALAARSPEGARALARTHVLHSGELLLAILEQMAGRNAEARPPLAS